MTGFLDRLPAWLRHFVIAVPLPAVGVFVTVEAKGIIAANGVSSFDWGTQFTTAVDAAAVTAAGGLLAFVALAISTATQQYGRKGDVTAPTAQDSLQ